MYFLAMNSTEIRLDWNVGANTSDVTVIQMENKNKQLYKRSVTDEKLSEERDDSK